MALVTGVTLPNDGDRIRAADHNVPINKILTEVNGNLDSTNIAPNSLPWGVMGSFTNEIPATAMEDSGNLEKFRLDAAISFIPDGLVWSTLSGLNGQMTSGHFYSTTGLLLTVAAIATRAFTASKDTYVYIDSAGVVQYSEVANGAAQPSLAAGAKWLSKVVTGASTISSITDMRQTQPIAASNIAAAAVTNEKLSTSAILLGYAQSAVTQTGITTKVDLTGMTVTVTVPTGGRMLELEYRCGSVVGTAGDRAVTTIQEGTTILNTDYTTMPSNLGLPVRMNVFITPSAGTHTYKVAAQSSGAIMQHYADATTLKHFVAKLV